MAKKKAAKRTTAANRTEVEELRHKKAQRKNNPPAQMASEGKVPAVPKAQYSYSPRRPPELQFAQDGGPDALPELLAEARERALTDDEVRVLADALRNQEPWLEWAGKRELPGFAVDPVALHIHERVATQAILKVAARQDVQRSLFADPQQAYHEAVQFYRHNIAWTNRLILGDSLQVMSSLARREDLAGKVQMIYIDPPYGIKFASNFQPEIGRRDVKDKETDLTREPEMVRAYRDTWHLGIHSYLKYLRDRLIVARELLADSGSVFVQISDENLHVVRDLLDEVFDKENFCSLITVRKTAGASSPYAKTNVLASVSDYVLWYARNVNQVKYSQLFQEKQIAEDGSSGMYQWAIDTETGQRRRAATSLASRERLVRLDNLTATGFIRTCTFDFGHEGRVVTIPERLHWKTTQDGMRRLSQAERVASSGTSLAYVRHFQDFAVYPVSNSWQDTASGGFTDEKVYVVQTNSKVVQRCMLMTTDPGDIVLDPTCGSGTTAMVAEQWGRRWITIDTSRVAVSIARQRLLTAKFEYYKLRELNAEDRERNPQGMWLYNGDDGVRGPATFACKSVPHVTLKSIAQNTNLDPIFAKHEPILEERLKACNKALAKVTKEVRDELLTKLVVKQRNEGVRAITDADRRRWELPEGGNRGQGTGDRKTGGRFEHWQVPFDTDEDWPKELREAVTAYRAAWRAKMDEVNACIAANADQEELVDQPEVVRNVVRVSGPFTVEAVQPPEMTLGEETVVETEPGLFDGEPENLDKTFISIRRAEPFNETQNLSAYLDTMVRLLRQDGVRFPNNKQMRFTRLDPLYESGNATGIHAEGRWVAEGQTDDDPNGPATVGVAFGPQYGPVTAQQVEELIRPASRKYEALVIAGFSFDGPSQHVIEEGQHPKLRIHAAHVAPDVNPGMTGLLKEQPGAQLFTVFGQPRTKINGPNKQGEYTVEMEGVDVYNPVDNSIRSTGADKVAAWFIDGDYDGRTFCITQAFFPDRTAWDKLARALDGVIDEDRFAALSGTVSLPFPVGKHKCVAVKVIDPRGNEVMQVHRLRVRNRGVVE